MSNDIGTSFKKMNHNLDLALNDDQTNRAALFDSSKNSNSEDKKMCGIMFLHICKAGGTYIGNTMRAWLYEPDVRNEETYQCCINDLCPSAPKFWESSQHQFWNCTKNDFHFVENEYNPYNRDVLDVPCIVTITSIRDPIQRVISHFLYEFKDANILMKGKPRTIELEDQIIANETLWNAYLDKGSSCPDHFWNHNHISNYTSLALDPWYGDVGLLSSSDVGNVRSTPPSVDVTYQKSNKMWKNLDPLGSSISSTKMQSYVQH